MLPFNFNAPTGTPVYTKQELNSFLPNPNVTGLLGSSLNFNAPNVMLPESYQSAYMPEQWEGPSKLYQLGNLLYSSGHPIFSFFGKDMMSKNPLTKWTFTSN